jgi:hypothetical protein
MPRGLPCPFRVLPQTAPKLRMTFVALPANDLTSVRTRPLQNAGDQLTLTLRFATSFFVIMPMMRVGKMVMAVCHRLVAVCMRVTGSGRRLGIMRVLVVLVMHVFVLVLE